MDGDSLKNMFQSTQERSNGKIDFSPEETERFKKAFDDAEFKKMFSEYMVYGLQLISHQYEVFVYVDLI